MNNNLKSDTEKPEVEFVEDIAPNSDRDVSSSIVNDDADDFSDINEKKVLRKMDLHLIPLLALLYLISFIDRGNVGNARIEGITVTLKLTEDEFNICVTIFFITYALFEIPSNILLKKIGRPSIYIPSIMVAWGIVMTLMGCVQNFGGFFASRLILGICESGLYPAVSYYLTHYYCKREMQFRQALFYGSATTAGAFSGLLAFAIAKMNGVGGYEGWRWIFIIEGLLTIVVAICSYFLLYDYPETASFFTERERKFVIWRLKNDSNATTSSAKLIDNTDELEAFKAVLRDWQCYLTMLIFIFNTSCSYGISLFLPATIKAMGYSNSQAQLLTIPIFIVGSMCTIVQSHFSDKLGVRSIFIIVDFIIVIVGFIMAIVGQETGQYKVIYGGVFLGVIGLYSGFPGIVTIHANNLANSNKRAIGMAFQCGFGNFGGVFAANFYKPTKLTLGHSLELGFSTMGLLCTLVLVFSYNLSNKRNLKALENGEFDDVSDLEFFRMGDKSPYYKYRL
ncbi:hypothetical protein WICANDRAFT_32532 [Wickerhamomyces anomalus NRRL Y-366-8]|uniref:Major facilitator superfamily (MFS) profile domain-containing protein n=1 Tax=Wickerhamomyces anomalus (strain ATCC 58044 / CBS 1984 / NCYC 433 / NRRL Y-366-8) TaxID=683960 RepID=A0A1E3P3M4_WICAA|nr:uncharacterized protein WICANDRAFT_32532 [Wickerhamomyces anomalus NRRL Y-366-8]ODQ59502.1 hypothetical protein WICANDRAFT_32532 [Wickerhamomyces anomalus NRRL Y-366-8]